MTGIALDEVQQRVVDHDGGPLLVLGGPGTGKTTLLVERWVRLATQTREPHRILLLVPTRDRALALREELPFRLPMDAVLEVPVHTWHALAYHLVTRYYRQLGYAQPPTRLTTAEQWTVVRDLLATEDRAVWGRYGEHLTTEAFAGEVADFCVRAGYRGLSDDELRELATQQQHAPIAEFALRYRETQRTESLLDYPELILSATRLLRDDTTVREAVRRRFTHVLVDDAQELAPAQLQLLVCLNLDHLVCTGDPDSAIEAFRGADPNWLDRFERVTPSHERTVLPKSHRFGKAIGDVAASLIERGAGDATHRSTEFADHKSTVEERCYATMAGEIEGAAREVRAAHIVDGVPYDRMAILLAQPGTYVHPLKRVLSSLKVPYRIDSGDRPLAEEPAVRSVLDLCRLTFAQAPGENVDDDLVKAVLNSVLVGLHPYEIRDLERDAFRSDTKLVDLLETKEGEGIEEYRLLRDAVRQTQDEPANATFAKIFETSRWIRTLVERDRQPEAGSTDGSERDDAHQLDALLAFADALAHFAERQANATMSEYLARSAQSPVGGDTWVPSAHSTGVHLQSFHSTKGAEWDVVCVIGVAEGLIPRAHRAQGLFDPWALEEGTPVDRAQNQLAEERRTLYVALTRARTRLVVSCSPGTRRATPSRFLEEAFGTVPDPIVPTDDSPPLTLGEAAARHRRTLARPDASEKELAAAAAALVAIPEIDPSAWWWRRDYTQGAPLYPSGKLTTSYSRIGTYDNCPLQYVLQSVLGLDPASTYQMKFGSLIHRIFERVDEGELTTIEQVIDVYKREFLEHHRKDYPNVQFARTYYTAGVKMLKLWWKTERSRGEVVAIEYSFDDLDVDGHTIRGRIDRITKNNQGLVLTDYKTSKSALSYDEARESLQLAIYYKAALTYDDLKVHGKPHHMELVYPGIEKKAWDAEESGCDRRVQRPDQAEEALKKLNVFLDDAVAEKFDPSPEADCRWCRMKILCPRFPEGKEIPR
jgi:superfamily I DNA/RNA helicase/RecB family exonuclease